jgi:hypothetical protein
LLRLILKKISHSVCQSTFEKLGEKKKSAIRTSFVRFFIHTSAPGKEEEGEEGFSKLASEKDDARVFSPSNERAF